MSSWDRPLNFDSPSEQPALFKPVEFAPPTFSTTASTFDSNFQSFQPALFQPAAFQPVSFEPPPAFSSTFDAAPLSSFGASPDANVGGGSAFGGASSFASFAAPAPLPAPPSYDSSPQPDAAVPLPATLPRPFVAAAASTGTSARDLPTYQGAVADNSLQNVRRRSASESGTIIKEVTSYYCADEMACGSVGSFSFTLEDRTVLSTLDSSESHGRVATSWKPERGSSIINVRMRSVNDELAWVFETDRGELSVVFGAAPCQLRQQRVISEKRVESLKFESNSTDGVLSPLSEECFHGKGGQKQIDEFSQLRKVEVYTSPTGVTGVWFYFDGSRMKSYGSKKGQCESLVMSDPGASNAEYVTDICALQDDDKLSALQFVTNRGRRSAWTLPSSEWRLDLTPTPGDVKRAVEQELSDARQRAAALATLTSGLDDLTIDFPTSGLEIEGASSDSRVQRFLTRTKTFTSNTDNSDGGCDSDCCRSTVLGCCGYTLGLIIVALFVYGCTATAYMYSTPTTLGIWLGVFLPCSLCVTLFAFTSLESCYVCEVLSYVCSASWVVGLLTGLLAAYLWLMPWYIMTNNGNLSNIDATATQLIQNRTALDYGIYRFNSIAFVNQAKFGYYKGGTSKSPVSYCVAPIVASQAQRQVVFWVVNTGCCSTSSISCWNSFTSAGSVQGGYPYVRFASTIDSGYQSARSSSCNALAYNSSFTGASLCSLPTVYLTLDSNPEELARKNYSNGMIFAGVMTGLWPCVAAIIIGVLALISAGKK